MKRDEAPESVLRNSTKVATNLKLVSTHRHTHRQTKETQRREKYETIITGAVYTPPYIQTQKYANGFTAPLFLSLLLFLVLLCFPHIFGGDSSFVCLCVWGYWYYYGAMLCNICKFLLLLPTTVFPWTTTPSNFPNSLAFPANGVDICWHLSTHCCRWCWFLFGFRSIFFLTFTI